jgi:hypothetical protein
MTSNSSKTLLTENGPTLVIEIDCEIRGGLQDNE